MPEARSPINLNTAPREVLIAVLADLRCLYLDEDITRTNFGSWSALPKDHNWYAIGIVRETSIDFAMAGTIADWIIANRGPLGGFRTWSQFNRFIDDAVLAGRFGSDGQEVFRGALVKANANPNNDLTIFNPNAVKYDRPVVDAKKALNDLLQRPVDKFMVIAYTTEFCFDSMGYFEIESLGKVYDSRAEVLAQHRIDTTVQVAKIWHLSTQRDFTDGNGLGGGYDIKDAKGGFPTPGNKSLQVYPEPNTSGWPQACRFDGTIQRATLRAEYDPVSRVKFYVPFETSFRAEIAGGNADMQPEASGPVLRSVLDPSILGGLFPDGMYAELDRSPAWFAPGNMPVSYNGPNRQHLGTIAFWVKPNWSISWSNKTHHLFSAMTNGTSDGDTLVFYIVYAGQYSGFERHLCFHSEGLRNGGNQRLISNAIELPGRMWNHIAIVYDTGAGGNWDQPHQMFINSVRVEPSHVRYPWDGGLSNVDDIQYDVWGNANLMRLGERPDRRGAAPSYEIPDGPLEGTLDELLILDRKLSSGEVQDLYRRGRFYPEKCEYQTPWVPADMVGSSSEIASVSWTLYLPTRDVFFPPSSATRYGLADYGVRNARMDIELLFQDGSKVKRKTDDEEIAEEGQPGDPNDGGWTVGRAANQRFRLKLKFPKAQEADPLLQSEALDDITVKILIAPQFRSWEVLP
ncbi:MAG: hypothetical protein HY720_21480 [Planctomycetes bacterium]|nr:hypothetical protein [Planctomycetota bacterium]